MESWNRTKPRINLPRKGVAIVTFVDGIPPPAVVEDLARCGLGDCGPDHVPEARRSTVRAFSTQHRDGKLMPDLVRGSQFDPGAARLPFVREWFASARLMLDAGSVARSVKADIELATKAQGWCE